MSNKPLKLIPKGRPLEAPENPARSRASPVRRLFRGRKRLWTKLGLGLCLAAVCTAYTAGLNQPATTVVAQKRELPVYSVERDDKVVSISFDASWGADKTIPILDILDQYGVKTTFFLVGGWVDKYPDMVKEIFVRGHEIGNHSNTHPQMSKLGEEGIREELRMISDKV